jgi:hypothetical protein
MQSMKDEAYGDEDDRQRQHGIEVREWRSSRAQGVVAVS